MTLSLELGGIHDPATVRAFQIIAQQFPITVTGGGGGGAPSGPASGDLGGTYPGPSVVKAQAGFTIAGVLAVLTTDTRLSDARTPTAHHTTHEPGGTDAMAVDAAAATGSLRTIGTGALQATAGNDSRLTNARTPTAHATTHQPGGSDAMAVDAVAATGSLRTLGTAATSAAAGNRGMPTGGATGTVLTKNSATDYDASFLAAGGGGAPSGPAGGGLAGTYPNPTLAARQNFMLRRTTNSASIATGASLVIPWDLEVADAFAMHVANATTVTIPTGCGGVWMVSAQCFSAANMDILLLKNGAVGAGSLLGQSNAGWMAFSGFILLAAGDTLSVQADNNSGASQVITGNTTNSQAAQFSGYWVSV